MITGRIHHCFKKYIVRSIYVTAAFVFCLSIHATCGDHPTDAGRLHVGVATVDITPPMPAALDGQMALRVATRVETPLKANVVLLDVRNDGASTGVTVFVSCDLVTIPQVLISMVRDAVARRLPDLDTRKIVINATHTHTAGAVREGWYTIPPEVLQVKSYHAFLSQKLADAIVQAWHARAPGKVSWGLNHAKTAYNRRAVYADGTAMMYGDTNIPEFRMIEGFEDQSIQSLFFWNAKGKLVAACINIASPAQIVETRSSVNADYWHPVRVGLQARFGKNLCVVGWIAAAGDQTPRPMYSHVAEKRMVALRNGEKLADLESVPDDFRTDAYLNEIARRIIAAVVETYEAVKTDRYEKVEYRHSVKNLELPMRLVTAEEYHESIEKRDEILKDPEQSVRFSRLAAWYDEVVKRYERQNREGHPVYPVEVHVIRMGDIVICTNPFELFTAFGVEMKSQSKALQTFVVQLVGPGTYVPTKEAVKGGHYSAVVQSNLVGPEGGQLLVDRTIEMINENWK